MTKLGNIIKVIMCTIGFTLGMTFGNYVYHVYGAAGLLILAGGLIFFLLAAIGVVFAIDVIKGKI